MPLGSGRERYPRYRPFVESVSRVRGASVLGELRVSRFLLEQLAGARVVSFRPGRLSYPFSLPQALQATGYRYSSSITANTVLTHLPYQLTHDRADSALQPVTDYRMEVVHPLLKRGSKGDMVVWAQEHLIAAGADLPVTGIFGRQTARAVRDFKEGHGLPANGVIDTDTWNALLTLTPYRAQWAARSGRASASRARPSSKPLSASLPAKAYEIPPKR